MFFLSLYFNLAFAQNRLNEGKILFDIHYEDVPIQYQSKVEQLAKDAVIYFKGNKSRTEMGIGIFGKNTTIVDKDSNTVFVLLTVFGNRFALKKTTQELTQLKNPNQTILNPIMLPDERLIAGFKCKHLVLKTVILSDTLESHCWYSPEIAPINFNNDPSFEKIEGMVLEFYVQADQMKIHLKAKEVLSVPIEHTQFKVPLNYQMVDEAELNKRMEAIMNKSRD
jgi:hypothetical protein